MTVKFFRAAGAEPVEVLRSAIRGRIPDTIFTLFSEYVDYGEAMVGVETLFDELDDNEVSIDRDIADLIVAAARDLNVTRFSAEQVYALVNAAP